MSSRIIVKNLPKDTTQEKLVSHIKKTCSSVEVTDCNLKHTKEGVFRRFAFVGFNSPEDAKSVHAKLNGTFIKTTKIQVELASDVGDGHQKSWSKYSLRNQKVQQPNATGNLQSGPATKGKEEKKSSESDADKAKATSTFGIRVKGLSGFFNEKTIRDFFKPIKLSSIRIPRSAQKKPIGVAFVQFSSQKDQDLAMGRNKNYINGKKVFLNKVTEDVPTEKKVAPAPWEVKAKASSEQEVEDIAESGRLFVRNLWFGVTEEELEQMFSKYGPLVEVSVPVDPLTKKVKGFAHVVFMFPEHALRAYTDLDYTSLHGRLMHILPGRESQAQADTNEKSSFKKKKDLQQKANASSTTTWNALFLGASAVTDVMAKKYHTDKSHILDDEVRGSLGVRVALGETQIVAETRQFLISNNVALDSFGQAAGERSKTVILVKNLPSGVSDDELRDIFSKYGTVQRVVMPPSGITAIVEYQEPSEARQGFMKLNFTKFRSIPLYLEWAPMGVFATSATASKKGKEGEKHKTEKQDDGDLEVKMEVEDEQSKPNIEKTNADTEVEPEDDSTIFVKNLNFSTTDEHLLEHFESFGDIVSATVARKKDPKKAGGLLSMGYGFVQFMFKKDAKEALKHLQNSPLDDHNLELKLSNRKSSTASRRHKQEEIKQKSTKILVRNIPFEAKKKELEELFKVFGELKFVRLPKKLGGTGSHRGFAFVDFLTKQDAQRAFNALCHSTHLYGRRLVLEWAESEESLEDLRRKTAQHFVDDEPRRKVSRASLKNELDG